MLLVIFFTHRPGLLANKPCGNCSPTEAEQNRVLLEIIELNFLEISVRKMGAIILIYIEHGGLWHLLKIQRKDQFEFFFYLS